MGGLRARDQATAIANVGTFVQAPTAGVVPVVHAISGGQQVAPGVVFVGRRKETERLLAALAPDGVATVVVSAVAGMGGVGKTALARFCAAEAVERGWFPGGAYVVDLQGYSPGGMVAGTSVFEPLLHQFGVVPEKVPAEPAAQAAVYDQALRVLAEQGQRVLLVLDNASTADQVKGLLPNAGGHRVVVTTRDTLAIPGARRLSLDVLTEADALALLDEALREHDPADDRAADGTALVEVCGLLPLAVRIAAGLLADEPATTCADLAEELANAPTDDFAHGETRVAPVLATSVDRLASRDPQAAQLLRLLPINPGPDLSTEAAAALGGLPVANARTSLRALRQAHLVALVDGRWRLHDLVRRYLLDRLGEQDAAATRLLDYYTTTAYAADDHVSALHGQAVPDLFTGRAQALAWFDAEHANLVAAIRWTAATDYREHATFLASALSEYQSWRRKLTDWLAVSQIALDICQRSGDRLAESVAWNHLGLALRELRRFDEAATAHERDLAICQEIGDRKGEGSAWNNLGIALRYLRRFDEAITAHERHLTICQEIGDRHGEASTWNNLGLALRGSGQFDEAITAHERARDIHQETGNRHREGMAWNNLGLALRESGRFNEAITAYEQACAIGRETGDYHEVGKACSNMGDVLLDLGRFDDVRRWLAEAAAAYTESGDSESAQDVQHLIEQIDDGQEPTGS